jgi:hypothetical protein
MQMYATLPRALTSERSCPCLEARLSALAGVDSMLLKVGKYYGTRAESIERARAGM